MNDPLFTLPPDLLTRLTAGRTLPEVLPASPFPLFGEWFNEAVSTKQVPNPNAMTLATIEPSGMPSARIVLCRGMSIDEGWIEFFTNYNGDKGRALAANPVASVVFHFDHTEKQVRMSGPVTKSPAESSDRYFVTRPWESRISAWASDQSRPLASRAELLERIPGVMQKLGVTAADVRAQGNDLKIPRPPYWGGFRLMVERCELWLGGPGRLHDRAVWTRGLNPTPGAWSATRLNP